MVGAVHMTAAEFREQGRRVVDWIADYMERVETMPIRPGVAPGDVAASMPAAPPERGEAWDAILGDLDRVVMPGVTHWQSPNFFGYFPASGSGPAILGDMASTGLGVIGMLWSTSPACTEVETRVLDWLGGMLGLPGRFLSTSGRGGGVIQGTASEATLVAMVAARDRAARAGAPFDRLVAYTSTQAHSSVVKAAMVSGLGRAAVRLIDVDGSFALRADLLRAAIEEDQRAGRTPFFVCATVGTTSSTAIDPVAEIAGAIAGTGAWLHIDAAFAGAMCLCPEHRSMIAGVERADSFNFNPHKWMLVNFDCSTMWVADREPLLDALSITPEYLRNSASDSGAVIDYRDWQIPLGRRFRALKLWFVIRHYGVEGLRAHVREHLRLAALFESWVRGDDRFEVAAPRTSSLVCFRLRSGDEATRGLLDRINASRRVFMTHTTLPDGAGGQRFVIRMAIGGTNTQERHVRAAWDLIVQEASAVSPAASRA